MFIYLCFKEEIREEDSYSISFSIMKYGYNIQYPKYTLSLIFLFCYLLFKYVEPDTINIIISSIIDFPYYRLTCYYTDERDLDIIEYINLQ